MIPKVIHYCWFGKNPLPELAQKCIASWEKFCPDYEIIEWNESNVDITQCKYMEDAYKEKKWGFVSDYARNKIIYENGGFYLDTDVEIIKPLDELLSHQAILGFESETQIAAGLIIASEKGNGVIKEMYELYHNLSFYNDDGSLNLTPSPVYNTAVLVKHGLIPNNTLQTVENITVFPTEYFCPKDFYTGIITITPNTYAIHHYDASWHSEREKKEIAFYQWVHARFGDAPITKTFFRFYGAYDKLANDGFAKTFNYYYKKYLSKGK